MGLSIDREKTIKGLESLCIRLLDIAMQDSIFMLDVSMVANAIALLKEQEEAYQGAEELLRQKTILFDDTIKRLKEQEAVKPEFDSLDGNVGRWRCGNCHISIGAVRAPYCWHCGKALKLNE